MWVWVGWHPVKTREPHLFCVCWLLLVYRPAPIFIQVGATTLARPGAPAIVKTSLEVPLLSAQYRTRDTCGG